jgi:putative oxidoreductase
MAQAFLVGRILVGCYYLFSAYHHFADLGPLAYGAAVHGVPAPQLAVIVAGLLLAVAGVTLLLGVFPRLGIGALLLFFVPVTVMMHPFWADTTVAGRQADLINFTKNMALLGSSLMFLAIPRPWPYSVERAARLPRRVQVPV